MPRLNFVFAKTGLDDRLALAVELAAAVGSQDAAHERVKAAVPSWSGAFPALGVGRDQDLDAAVDEAFDLVVGASSRRRRAGPAGLR
jgi:hypothetical protein